MSEQFDLKIPSFKLWKNGNGTGQTNNTEGHGVDHISDRDNHQYNDEDVSNTVFLPTSPTNRTLYNRTRPLLSDEPQTVNLDMEWSHLNGDNVSNQDIIPYNVRPFFGDRLVSQSKIDALKETEITEHCLIFHKDVDHDFDFRPDLCLDCGNTKYKNATYNKYKSDRNCYDDNYTLGNFNRMERRNKSRNGSHIVTKRNRISSLSMDPCGFIREFWKSSDLLNSMDPNHLEILSAIVCDEMEEIHKLQLHLNGEDDSTTDLDIPSSLKFQQNYRRALAIVLPLQRHK